MSVVRSQLSPPLPYDDGFFDYVYANPVFTHMRTDTLSEWITELARIVRSGGRVIVSVFSPNRYWLAFRSAIVTACCSRMAISNGVLQTFV